MSVMVWTNLYRFFQILITRGLPMWESAIYLRSNSDEKPLTKDFILMELKESGYVFTDIAENQVVMGNVKVGYIDFIEHRVTLRGSEIEVARL